MLEMLNILIAIIKFMMN